MSRTFGADLRKDACLVPEFSRASFHLAAFPSFYLVHHFTFLASLLDIRSHIVQICGVREVLLTSETMAETTSLLPLANRPPHDLPSPCLSFAMAFLESKISLRCSNNLCVCCFHSGHALRSQIIQRVKLWCGSRLCLHHSLEHGARSARTLTSLC